MGTRMDEARIREDIVLACRGLAVSGMGDMIGGHVSVRVPGEAAYWCNAFDRALAEVTPDDVVKVAFDGTMLTPGRYVSVGLNFHSGIYGLRPDVNAIVHSHGHWITAQAAFARPPQCWHNLATLFENQVAMSPDDSLGTAPSPSPTPSRRPSVCTTRWSTWRAWTSPSAAPRPPPCRRRCGRACRT
jgi:ribulose-5-phosphate 4-epimerase/fuculose-1-phosphate aldolase